MLRGHLPYTESFGRTVVKPEIYLSNEYSIYTYKDVLLVGENRKIPSLKLIEVKFSLVGYS